MGKVWQQPLWSYYRCRGRRMVASGARAYSEA